MLSRNIFLMVGGGVVFFAALIFYCVSLSKASDRFIFPERTVVIDGTPLYVAVADSPQERDKGLGGITNLKPDQGMLFTFDTDGQYSFWMKDMVISIDILWLSSDGRVVYIEKSVSPNTFPQAFTPDTPARYVLEVPAGFSREHGIEVGRSTVTF